MNHLDYKTLTFEKIQRSKYINEWLTQFEENDKNLAITMLTKLRFVSRDTYAQWLQQEISNNTIDNTKYAFYSVRKLDTDESDKFIPYWDNDGCVIDRPGESQGSEDFIYSLISNFTRAKDNLYDHASIQILKENRIKNLILIDDAIGSGKRVYSFINSMLHNKTLKSWWSLGYINFHIYSFIRNSQAPDIVIKKVIGSDHSSRVYRKSSKIIFYSKYGYSDNLENRWGEHTQEILNLCSRNNKIQKWARKGYGRVMSNLVFYHSVPNNIPGIFWFGGGWNPLFPERALPDWIIQLLENNAAAAEVPQAIPQQAIDILMLIKKGYVSKSSLSMALDIDINLLNYLLNKCITFNLLDRDTLRLTTVGRDFLHKNQKTIPKWNKELYIPTSWCSG
ncbi:phosphoribosyltransferase-like protein [Acinetobacter junii]|uniref:phosphoribosyltransferase-like protein n=1 Tax=Acinetobacter junii TaxID=40215 RepID=UPI00321557B0